MEYPRSNLFVVLSYDAACLFVQDNQARGIGCGNEFMIVIDAVAGVDVEQVAIDQDRVPPRIVLDVSAPAGALEPADVRIIEDHLETVVGKDVDLNIKVVEYKTIEAPGD